MDIVSDDCVGPDGHRGAGEDPQRRCWKARSKGNEPWLKKIVHWEKNGRGDGIVREVRVHWDGGDAAQIQPKKVGTVVVRRERKRESERGREGGAAVRRPKIRRGKKGASGASFPYREGERGGGSDLGLCTAGGLWSTQHRRVKDGTSFELTGKHSAAHG